MPQDSARFKNRINLDSNKKISKPQWDAPTRYFWTTISYSSVDDAKPILQQRKTSPLGTSRVSLGELISLTEQQTCPSEKLSKRVSGLGTMKLPWFSATKKAVGRNLVGSM